MTRALVALALFAGALPLAGAADDAAKKLDGTYSVVELLINGKPNKKGDSVKSVVIKAGELTIVDADREEKANFKVDATKKPAHIDLSAAKNDQKVLGIYETKETDKGLELTICFVHAGPNATAERPKDFKGEGEATVVFKLLRKK